MKNNFLILLLLGILSACGSKQDSAQEKADSTDHAASEHAHHMSGTDPQVQELMAVHDSIMLQMDAVMSLKRDLKTEIKTLDSLQSKEADNTVKAKKEQAETLLSGLDQADKAMMDWMHHYKADTIAKLDAEKKKVYIQDQREEIQKVGEQISKSITEARHFVNP